MHPRSFTFDANPQVLSSLSCPLSIPPYAYFIRSPINLSNFASNLPAAATNFSFPLPGLMARNQ